MKDYLTQRVEVPMWFLYLVIISVFLDFIVDGQWIWLAVTAALCAWIFLGRRYHLWPYS
jgi:hypothetical protein